MKTLIIIAILFTYTMAPAQNIIHGRVTGDAQAGIEVNLCKEDCGGESLVGTFITNLEGYYSFGCLDVGNYTINPTSTNHIINPEYNSVTLPQAEIQSYDFTATEARTTCEEVDRFLDNSDGTVTDCRTGLLWLKNANCFGFQHFGYARLYASEMKSGECGLSDGSSEGDWRVPSKEELQGIGTDPSTTWYEGPPSSSWSMPGEPFVNVRFNFYWTSTSLAADITKGWYVAVSNGSTLNYYKTDFYYVWAVRSDPSTLR